MSEHHMVTTDNDLLRLSCCTETYVLTSGWLHKSIDPKHRVNFTTCVIKLVPKWKLQ
jgi:hypothetical protein